ncbi:MAG: SpoIIE family protein phosphatase [Planctomycetes bacterium]|nr:SpoIIE family protein phosphatase [Planctomycetota bacterium]
MTPDSTIVDSAGVTNERKVRDLATLLDITRALQAEKDLDRLLAIIVEATTRVMEAERSSLFLLDHEKGYLWSKIAQGAGTTEIRVPIGVGIAGAVARTGETVNIPDAYADPRFNPDVDRRTGFRTRSILCMPLSNHEGKRVGVIQVLNKIGGTFSRYDEDLLCAFGTQAAIAIDNAQLIEHYLEKQRIQAALGVAREIQLSLLPKQAPGIAGLEIAGKSVACDETGGDYYDYLQLDDTHLGIVIGDVSGHGVGAALLMATARATLRAFIEAMDDIRDIFANLNRLLERDMDAGRFMTMFYGVLDTSSRRIQFINAGHDAPILFHRSTGKFESLDSTALPLGMLEGVSFVEVGEAVLSPGDLLCLTTDGVWEATNENFEPFGKERLQQLLAEGADLSCAELVERVYRAVMAFCGKNEQRDDITLICIKAAGGK